MRFLYATPDIYAVELDEFAPYDCYPIVSGITGYNDTIWATVAYQGAVAYTLLEHTMIYLCNPVDNLLTTTPLITSSINDASSSTSATPHPTTTDTPSTDTATTSTATTFSVTY